LRLDQLNVLQLEDSHRGLKGRETTELEENSYE